METKERSASIDFIRCIACLSVIVIHIIAIFWINTPIRMLSAEEYLDLIAEYKDAGQITYQSSLWYVLSFCDALMRFCVPIFIMISGALVLTKIKVDIGYALKKVKDVITLIIVWGGVISLFQVVTSILLNQPLLVSSILQNIVSGPAIFWFMFVLLPLYVASPIYHIIVNNKSASLIFIIFWFVFSILYPFLRDYILHYDFIKLHYLYLFSEYSGYFVVGGYLSKYGLNKKVTYIIYLLAILSIITMTFGVPVGYYHNYLTPFAALYSTALFLLLRNVRFSSKSSKVIVKCAQYTLGIYAIHPLIIEILLQLTRPSFDKMAIEIPMYFGVTLFTSVIIIYLLKRIPFLRKYT